MEYFLLIVVILVLLFIISYKYIRRIEKLKKENQRLVSKNITLYNDYSRIKGIIKHDKLEVDEKDKIIKDLEEIIKAFSNLNSSLSVYTMSNIHKNFSFYNKRFYAKINNKPKDNKAEAIPILNLENSKSIVVDLYKFNTLIKENNSIIDSLRNSYIAKSSLISELGNKILKNYKG